MKPFSIKVDQMDDDVFEFAYLPAIIPCRRGCEEYKLIFVSLVIKFEKNIRPLCPSGAPVLTFMIKVHVFH